MKFKVDDIVEITGDYKVSLYDINTQRERYDQHPDDEGFRNLYLALGHLGASKLKAKIIDYDINRSLVSYFIQLVTPVGSHVSWVREEDLRRFLNEPDRTRKVELP